MGKYTINMASFQLTYKNAETTMGDALATRCGFVNPGGE
jgi:hypothetical protein